MMRRMSACGEKSARQYTFRHHVRADSPLEKNRYLILLWERENVSSLTFFPRARDVKTYPTIDRKVRRAALSDEAALSHPSRAACVCAYRRRTRVCTSATELMELILMYSSLCGSSLGGTNSSIKIFTTFCYPV